ncbi:MAG: hypothetical protein J07HQW1_01547 [Haloquadratum walsbyi J07HQW1]|uniref:Uncharacterized protein n=1 Tax=Haloquadratum walsbyi J07HQW1 TaxID=1238424 RepID=U1N533_9EURY|nr:MAG: hypothetical protein J07HQW1_01547 [Haloquadratum walsbyi J07HQW1]
MLSFESAENTPLIVYLCLYIVNFVNIMSQFVNRPDRCLLYVDIRYIVPLNYIITVILTKVDLLESDLIHFRMKSCFNSSFQKFGAR